MRKSAIVEFSRRVIVEDVAGLTNEQISNLAIEIHNETEMNFHVNKEMIRSIQIEGEPEYRLSSVQRRAMQQVADGLGVLSKEMSESDDFCEWIESTPFFECFSCCINEASLNMTSIIPDEKVHSPLFNRDSQNIDQAVLTSQTGGIIKPKQNNYVFSAQKLEMELSKFLRLISGFDVTPILVANEYNEVSMSIKEVDELIAFDFEEMTLLEYLEKQLECDLKCYEPNQVARHVMARFLDIDVNDLVKLQFEDGSAVILVTIECSAFQGVSDKSIGGSYIARRGVSNLLYCLLKAADQDVNLSLTYPECSHFEDVVYGSLLEWVSDFEDIVSKGDTALSEIEELLKEELVNGSYLSSGSQVFIEKLQAMLAPENDDPKQLFIYKMMERLVWDAESVRLEQMLSETDASIITSTSKYYMNADPDSEEFMHVYLKEEGNGLLNELTNSIERKIITSYDMEISEHDYNQIISFQRNGWDHEAEEFALHVLNRATQGGAEL